jgi:hypothetical protein
MPLEIENFDALPLYLRQQGHLRSVRLSRWKGSAAESPIGRFASCAITVNSRSATISRDDLSQEHVSVASS